MTRNPEIGNTCIWVRLNIWILTQETNTKFGSNVSDEMLPDTAKCQGCSFYRFWFLKGKKQLEWLTYPKLELNNGFTTAVLKALGKLPNVMERLHKLLTGFFKIYLHLLKTFLKFGQLLLLLWNRHFSIT